jgi:hypothetical protein
MLPPPQTEGQYKQDSTAMKQNKDGKSSFYLKGTSRSENVFSQAISFQSLDIRSEPQLGSAHQKGKGRSTRPGLCCY